MNHIIGSLFKGLHQNRTKGKVESDETSKIHKKKLASRIACAGS